MLNKGESVKIEVDLNDIFSDEEYGSETLQESIKRQVVAKLKQESEKKIQAKIDREVSLAIDEQIKKSIEDIRPKLLEDILNTEYYPITQYGDRSKESTTFRKQLVKVVTEGMVYSKRSGYTDQNAFSKTVDEVISTQVNIFKKEFDSIVNAEYVKQTKEYAVKILKEKMGL